MQRPRDAREQLAFLQSLRPVEAGAELFNPEWVQARLRQTGSADLAARYEQVEKSASDPMGAITAYFAQHIVGPFIAALPAEFQARAEAVPWGFVHIRAVNAHAMRAPNGEALIVVNQGLLHMASFFMELKSSVPTVNQQFGIEGVQRFLRGSYGHIVRHFEAAGGVAFPLPTIPLPENVVLSSVQVAMAMEAFVIAHEYAHVVAGHLEGAATSRAALDDGDRDGGDFYQLSQRQEFEADAIGWAWYQAAWSRMPLFQSMAPVLARAAPLFFFQLLVLIERNVPNHDRFSTHPPAIERFETLARSLAEGSEDTEFVEMLLDDTRTIPDLRTS